MTLIELLRYRAHHQPGKRAFAFLEGLGDQDISFITYGELDARARQIASVLQARHLQGNTALLAYPAGFEFISALFGCLYAGVIAVPVNSPRRNSHMKRFASVAKDAGSSLVLTGYRSSDSGYAGLADGLGEIGVLNTEAIEEIGHCTASQSTEDSIAYIQYTSGSTSDPKGVVISHRNVLSNCRGTELLLSQDASSTFVCWAPNFHDMGLIHGIMQPLYGGNLSVLMSPVRFVQNPLLWLETIARFRATHSMAPNFAFDLCVEKLDLPRLSGLDLSSCRAMQVGAEPVRLETLERFQRCFQPYGFGPRVFRPGYGLAEATLRVTSGRLGETVQTLSISAESLKNNRVVEVPTGKTDARILVGCGRAEADATVLIVNPNSLTECEQDEIGEIVVRSDSVAEGYWNKPIETGATLNAVVNGRDGYLRTGDLGFLRDGELFIVGRKKDLIIVRGGNYHPQDIERIAEFSHTSIRPGFSAAFGIEANGEERLVIVLEVQREKRKSALEPVAGAVVKGITDYFDLRPHTVLLLNPGGVPRTSSGKVQRRATRQAFLEGQLDPAFRWDANDRVDGGSRQAEPPRKSMSREALQQWLTARVARASGLEIRDMDVSTPFVNFGIDSREAITISAELERLLGCSIRPSALYEWPSISRLADRLSSAPSHSVMAETTDELSRNGSSERAIAIVGLACRFPGASNTAEFWDLLAQARDGIREVPGDRWNADEFYDSNPRTPRKTNTKWGGFLDSVDRFDAAFFGVSPREAAQMDPQQGLLLELAWEAVEDAGIPRSKTSGSVTGVFVGIATSDYAQTRYESVPDGDIYRATGTAHSIAANRISYSFDWRGPSIAIDTACSSSLVAVHLATQALRNGECSVALAGGVNVILSPEVAIHLAKAEMMASDGRCKTFDSRADGYVRSEGAGLVVLKPLAAALEDGDRIYCILRGSAVNQDGRSNGILAPSREAQIEVIREACRRASVKPGDVLYVEAHGTGTLLGDAIEVSSLSEVLAEGRATESRCLVGSVKSNIGHLEAAAGIAGLIKVALSLWHGEIPPTLHFVEENPHVQFTSTCLEVARTLTPWSSGSNLAGVSSFGFGGTNSHVLVEGARHLEKHPDAATGSRCLVLPISARTPDSLAALRKSYLALLDRTSDSEVYDVCSTAATRRTHHGQRFAAVGSSKADLAAQLARHAETLKDGVSNTAGTRIERKTVFVFSGQGSHWTGMGQELLSVSAVFRAAISECDRALRKHSSWPLLTWMQDQGGDACEALDCRLPAIFSIQVALAAYLKSLGVHPDAVVGHSMGELAAAYVAGALALEEAMRLVYVRGKLLKKIQGAWGVLLVSISAAELSRYLAAHQHRVFVTAFNSPHSTVVTGDPDALAELTKTLQGAHIRARTVAMEYPSHCPAVEPLKSDFRTAVGELEWHKPTIPIVSTVTGDSGEEVRWDPDYWWRNLREPVRFSTAIARLLEDRANTFIEISPHCILSGALSECAKELNRESTVIPAMIRGRRQDLTLLEGVARLYSAGLDVNWERLFVPPGRTVSLPTYPFDRQRYWTDVNGMKSVKPSAGAGILPEHLVSSEPERKRQLIQQLRAIVAPLLEIDSEKLDLHAPFLELGADSIVLVRVTEAIQRRLGVSLSIGDLFQRYSTLDAVAAYVLQNDRGADITELPGAGAGNVRDNPHIPPGAEPLSAVRELMAQQLNTVERVIAEQLRLLRNSFPDVAAPPAPPTPQKQVLPQTAKVAEEPAHQPSIDVDSKQLTVVRSGFVPYTPIRPWDDTRGNGRAQQHLKQLVARLTAKSKRSKELTQLHRGRLADNRASAGFRFSVKEMLYPIIGHRSYGSRVSDVDGNEYLDLTMGFGVNLFGHNPPFVTEAIAEQLALGMQLGPQSELAGEVAELVCEFTGMDRAVFVNSGTEAVMTAIRLARTATGRKKVVLFAGSYHGTFDGVLGKGKSAGCEAEPIAPGVPPSMVQDLVVLDYGEPGSLEIIRKIGHECACVLAEPVQSRRPALQPREYLRELRTLASELDIALIFDEVITGFRVAPGGAQEVFGVKADLATYGKVLGGGMPIGAVAGATRFLDGIDGGHWSYGDASYPGATTTFFAGTFCKHPLTMAAARAVLKHLRTRGPSLQRELNDRALDLSATLNTFFEKEDAPLRISNFGSLFRFSHSNNLDLLFYNLLDRGIYVWEGRNCFLSTAHSKRDVDTIVSAVQDTICQLKADGILESSGPPARPAGVMSEKTAARSVRLTDAQKLLWTLTQLDERASVAYNVSVGLEMQGPLDVALLVKAINYVVQQHEALRETISADGDRQVIADQLEIECPVEDLSALYREHKSERRTEWIRAQAAARFDLNAGPLFRASLLKAGSADHLLILTAHHIVADGWSMGILVGQVCTSYYALAGGRVPELRTCLQFSEYAVRLAQKSQAATWPADREYWLNEYAASIPELILPTSKAGLVDRSYSGDFVNGGLKLGLVYKLQEFAKARHCTPFMTLFAAYGLMLQRITGQPELVIGVPVAGRSFEGAEGVVGYCIEVAPVKLDLSSHRNVTQHLTYVKQKLLEALSHNSYSLGELIRELRPNRHVGRTPLFNAVFNFERAPDLVEIHGLETCMIPIRNSTSKFDIGLNLVQHAQGLDAELEYSSDLLDRDDAASFLACWQELVGQMIEHPERRVSELRMVAGEERSRVVERWNDTACEYPRESSIAELFEAQVARDPGAIAVVAEDASLSYEELNRRANQLGRYLRRLGVGVESRVGICVERSPEMVVALLGILKAGGAYVPLDAEYPQERLAFMVEDARLAVLVTETRLLSRLPESSARILCLDAERDTLDSLDRHNLTQKVTAANLAYIIYTSGSTGKPKGAMNTQGGLCNVLVWMQRMYGLDGSDRVLQKTPFSFDGSVWEFFWPLLWGACLVMARPGGHRDPEYLIDVIVREQVTIIHFVPSMLRIFLGAEQVERCASLKRVFCIGEALTYELASEFFRRLGAELHNLYGPTEAAIEVTSWPCERGIEGGPVPIGKPIANTQMYVLEQNLEPAPVGVLGEVYIGGDGLARGYWKRAGLTAERFVPNPFSRSGGERLYRTGDLGRWRSDGYLEYVGRTDYQVKIRGFRIELGEIEAALKRQAGVRDCVVEVREEVAGDKRLVAYVVGTGAGEALVAGWRQQLRQSLPDYMLPSSFVLLEKLPLTPNGKLDRRALPAPGATRPELEKHFEAPRNEVEQVLAGIWRELLRLEQVGVHDNFFELGGDSILGIQVIARASQALGVRLTVKQLFQQQTIAELAAVAVAEEHGQAEQGRVEGKVELTPIQRWFFEQEMAEAHYCNQAVLLEVAERISAGAWKRVVQALLEQHDQLRASFHYEQGEWRQRIAGGVGEQVPYRYEDCVGLRESEFQDRLARVGTEIQGGFRLSEGPLLRAAYFDRGEKQRGRLLLVAHHLVVDAVSWRIVVEDLEAACRQVQGGQELRLPAKTGSYQQWARWLVKSARGQEWEADRAYWLAEAERPGMAMMPVDYQEGENDAGSVETASVWLEAEESRALLQEVPQAYHTQINDALLTALLQGWERSTGRRAMTVDLEGHGRETVSGEGEVDVSRTVGWFTSIFPVRLELPAGAGVGEALKAVKEQLRKAPRHGMGYGVLRYCSPEKELGERLAGMAEGEISFNYLGQIEAGALRESKLLRLAPEHVGREQSERSRRAHLIDITGQVVGGRLQLQWFYSRNRHRRETIEKLAAGVTKALRALIDHCRSSQISGFTPSDFPNCSLTQTELDSVIKTYGGEQIANVYRLSPMQQGLLFIVEAGQSVHGYMQQVTCVLHGDLDLSDLKRSWARVVDRHESLRASFVWQGIEHPVQVIAKEVELPFEETDWRTLSQSEQQERWDALLASDRECRFDLSRAPLMRWVVARIGEDSYRLLWSHHHLLVDGWSLPVVLKEVLALYEEFRRGRDLRLPQAPAFSEYIAWLGREDSSEAREFWVEALRGYSEPLTLCIDRGRGQVHAQEAKNTYREHEISLSETQTQNLEVFARRRQLTINTIVQGAWAVLLSRYSGRQDVVFGATVSGRSAPVPGIETVVGMCINTLPVRTCVDGRSILSWLNDLQAFNVKARQYEHTPLAEVHGWSEVPRGQPLFESILVFENYPVDLAVLQGGGITLRSARLYGETEYPLGLGIDLGPRLIVKIAYDLRRFEPDTIDRLIGHLTAIWSEMIEHPERRVSELRMVAGEERSRVVERWNDTACKYPRESSIAELFEAQVGRDREAIAVAFEGTSLTYGELNERANQLAHYLQRQGVGVESRVGICVERSPEMVVALLGILKAGGAYVPLDAEYPQERLAFMVEDARLAVLVTETRLLSRLPESGARILCLDAERDTLDSLDKHNLTHQVTAANLAYIIYTSGSTGKPKGAMNTHGGLCNRLVWMQRMYGLDGSDRVLQKTAFSFDVSVWEFFWPLLWGACLVVARPGGHGDPEYLIDVIVREQVTTIHFVPSMLRIFLGAEQVERCASLKRVFCSGEALTYELASEFFRRLGAELHNLYGPTEAAIDVTYWECERGIEGGPVPIGKPIANTQMYVLEENLEPAPVGVLGEVYIGGDGLARGYWKRAGLTAERFVPNPFSRRGGERLYRTGDLGRWRSDGYLEYVGRTDYQVKIRGFRIELGEIEAALKRQAGVRDCVVEVREEVAGDKRLVAYVVGTGAGEALVAGWRQQLRQSLPDYMLPSSFVLLEKLPLTPNGKLDRRALPAPGATRPELEKHFEAPRNEVEQVLAGIWRELLRLEQVGVHDNFFELGGHSLLLIQLASRIHSEFLANVPLRVLFDDPTIAGITDAIACAQAETENEQELALLISQISIQSPAGKAASAN